MVSDIDELNEDTNKESVKEHAHLTLLERHKVGVRNEPNKDV